MLYNLEENLPNLPKLPVPKLKDTLSKYIKSIKPIVTKEELINTMRLVEEFECSETALKLQHYLEKRAKEKLNWFDEWFVNVRYLDNRLPTALYGCPAQMCPIQNFLSQNDRLNFSSKLILGALSYKLLIDSKSLPIDRSGNVDLDMSQYDRIFGTCRIPGYPSDKQEFYPKSEHIIVAYRNQFFKLQVLYNSKPISEQEIFHQLETVIVNYDDRVIPIGILTTAERDVWSAAYQELIKQNYSQINDIQSSLFLVCLDEPAQMDNSINTMTEAGKQLIHGGGSQANSGNRWFDKTVQFVVGDNGITGLVYEHSFCDGQPIASMVDYVTEFIRNSRKENTQVSDVLLSPRKLEFHITEPILAHINASEMNFNKLVENSDIEWFKFGQYGKNYIKSAKLSPDSYVQIALQFAYYRLHKNPAIIYEAVSTRKYAKGGTESLRSFSEESVSFIQVALNSTTPKQELFAALNLAVNTHKKYCTEAGDGYGTERHFMGLKLAAKEMGVGIPSIFLDASYIKSTTKRLATSQVTTKCDTLMGYGTIPTDLYAACYNLRDNDINFALYSFKSNSGTNIKNMKDALIASLCEMQDILLQK